METVGFKKVGVTALKELLASTSDAEFISAVLPGGSAVTYAMGTALVNSATAGVKAKYTNATTVTSEAVATGNASTKTFDLAHAGVVASSLKGFVAGAQWNAKISVGTGTAGVDQIVFETAPTNAAAVTAKYDYHSTTVGTTGACILAEDCATTVAGGNVISNGLIEGNVKSALVLDSAGAAVDAYFKAAVPAVRFE